MPPVFLFVPALLSTVLPQLLAPPLTPPLAKAALLQMMRTKAGQDLGWFAGTAPEEMAKLPVELAVDGWQTWTAAFRIHPAKAVYTFTVRPRPGARACLFEYEGVFVNRNGVWTATAPKLIRTILQSGQ